VRFCSEVNNEYSSTGALMRSAQCTRGALVMQRIIRLCSDAVSRCAHYTTERLEPSFGCRIGISDTHQRWMAPRAPVPVHNRATVRIARDQVSYRVQRRTVPGRQNDRVKSSAATILKDDAPGFNLP
jgi:hypothetical protein